MFVVGNSGSGKSTLIKLLLKELDPTSGTITVNGQQLNKLRRRKVAKYRRGVGVVFQDFRLLKDRNVYENVAFAQRVIERPTRIIRKRVPEVLTLVGLAEKYKSKPDQLSGGEQQRVALARALVNRPNILLADEPTGNLDPKNSFEIMKLLEEINERGTTVQKTCDHHEERRDCQRRTGRGISECELVPLHTYLNRDLKISGVTCGSPWHLFLLWLPVSSSSVCFWRWS